MLFPSREWWAKKKYKTKELKRVLNFILTGWNLWSTLMALLYLKNLNSVSVGYFPFHSCSSAPLPVGILQPVEAQINHKPIAVVFV